MKNSHSTVQVLRGPDGRHYLRDSTGILWDSGRAVEAPTNKVAAQALTDYPPARMAELLLGLAKCGRRISASVVSRLASIVKDKSLAYSRELCHTFQGERKMATKKTAKAATKPTSAKKAAPAAKKVAAKKSAPVAAPSGRGHAPAYGPDATIRIKVSANPKRGTAAERFELYKDGMTVSEYLAAGGLRADVNWDVKKEFIEVR